jgi:hypothetical protein
MMRTGVLFLVLLTVVCPLYAAVNRMQGCDDWIVRIADVAESGKGLLFLQPGQERFLIGSMVSVPGKSHRRKLLLLSGYAGQHHVLHSAVNHFVLTGEIESFRYEWLGETRWLNPHEFPTQASLVESNETAGFFPLRVVPEDLGRNRIGKYFRSLQDHDRAVGLRGKRIRTLSPTRLRIPFERSQITRSFHLMPGLDEFIEVLDQMASNQLIDPNENYRHYIPAKVAALFGAVDTILDNLNGQYPTEPEKLNALHHQFHYMLHKESVQMMLKWLRNDGVRNSTIDRLSEMMRTLMARPLSYGEWIQFQEIKNGFNDFVSDYLDPNSQLARVEIYELES